MIPYLHKKHWVNYLTRGVKKHSTSWRWGENFWASVNHYHMTTHVLKVEHSCMSVIQHQRRPSPPPPAPPSHRSEGAARHEECWRAERLCGTTMSFTCLILHGINWRFWTSMLTLQSCLLFQMFQMYCFCSCVATAKDFHLLHIKWTHDNWLFLLHSAYMLKTFSSKTLTRCDHPCTEDISSLNLCLTLLVAVALEPRTTGTLVTCTDRKRLSIRGHAPSTLQVWNSSRKVRRCGSPNNPQWAYFCCWPAEPDTTTRLS